MSNLYFIHITMPFGGQALLSEPTSCERRMSFPTKAEADDYIYAHVPQGLKPVAQGSVYADGFAGYQ